MGGREAAAPWAGSTVETFLRGGDLAESSSPEDTTLGTEGEVGAGLEGFTSRKRNSYY